MIDKRDRVPGEGAIALSFGLFAVRMSNGSRGNRVNHLICWIIG
ncbi:hypothetical protein NIES2104_56950 [Leptolyngbya sp. NIES-2104]|nr:hypothetical protein NIES2104_56950 [Leptolyngbya sp. NIES-2104]